MEDMRIEEFKNETAVGEYENCMPEADYETEGENGLVAKLILGGTVAATAIGVTLFAKRKQIKEWHRKRQIEKAKRIMMANGYGIVEQSEIVIDSDTESEEDSETEE